MKKLITVDDNELKPITVLLVEDNQSEALLAKTAFQEAGLKVNLMHVSDGEEAKKLLLREDNFSDITLPDLILLDLEIPKIHGHDLLEWIKSDSKLKKIPVVILTTSEDKNDIDQSYGAHANSFITKPLEYESFIDVIKQLDKYWLTVAKLPSI